MADALDFKKQYKDLYLPKAAPVRVDVPAFPFLMIDGAGDPNGEAYQRAVAALYALAYTIKMSKKGDVSFPGYVDFVVPPLEGLWWITGNVFDFDQRDNWLWTSMLRVPDFVDQHALALAQQLCAKKKPDVDVSAVRLERFTEGACVQMLHIGPYATEPATVEAMRAFMAAQGLRDMTGDVRKHHEIYLSDPRTTAPEKMKTVLRHPVA